MGKLGKILIAVVVLAVAWHYYCKISYTHLALDYFKKFTYDPLTNSYVETTTREFFPKKVPRAVLLVQGFNVSPEIFSVLYPELEKAEIPYYAPRLSGYGLGDFHLLNCINGSDWTRDTVRAYDLLANYAEKVDVIGFSMGTFLSLVLAQNRPVNKMILISPGIVLNKDDEILTQALQMPVIGSLVKFLMPVYKEEDMKNRARGTAGFDALDIVKARRAFVYKAEPINTGVAVKEILDAIDLKKLPKDQKMYILYGTHDETLNMEASLAKFKEETHPTEIIPYNLSAHDLPIDVQREQATKDILRILNSP